MHSIAAKSIHNHFLKKPFFTTSVDKHLKWIPFATVFVLDLFGVRTRSGWKKQILLTGLTEAMRYLMVDNLKKLTKEHRPFPRMGNHSFPSGHTASSFAGAEILHTELKSSMPVLSCAGYVGAIATAVIRCKKNKHWLNDVVCGAAVGILAVKLAYLVVDKKNKKIKQNIEEKQVDIPKKIKDPERLRKVY
jgi:membrane-associated phospholipid phosphatase